MKEIKNGDEVYCTNHSHLLDRYEKGVYLGEVVLGDRLLHAVLTQHTEDDSTKYDIVTKMYVMSVYDYDDVSTNIKTASDAIIDNMYEKYEEK